VGADGGAVRLAVAARQEVQGPGHVLAAHDLVGGVGLADGDRFSEQLVQDGKALGERGLAVLGKKAEREEQAAMMSCHSRNSGSRGR
jgi:hypothetical protein